MCLRHLPPGSSADPHTRIRHSHRQQAGLAPARAVGPTLSGRVPEQQQAAAVEHASQHATCCGMCAALLLHSCICCCGLLRVCSFNTVLSCICGMRIVSGHFKQRRRAQLCAHDCAGLRTRPFLHVALASVGAAGRAAGWSAGDAAAPGCGVAAVAQGRHCSRWRPGEGALVVGWQCQLYTTPATLQAGSAACGVALRAGGGVVASQEHARSGTGCTWFMCAQCHVGATPLPVLLPCSRRWGLPTGPWHAPVHQVPLLMLL